MQKTQLAENEMKKVALLGDSIFDNQFYVSTGMAVIDQIDGLIKDNWDAELLAIDGATTQEIPGQCQQVSSDMSHLVISIGGNDALSCADLLYSKVQTVYQGLHVLAEIKTQFYKSYRKMIEAILLFKKNIILCSIYDTCPELDPALRAALSVFNDVILYEAFRIGAPVLDLRHTFNSPGDYSAISSIEPSESGGAKIANSLKYIIESHDFSCTRSSIYH